MSTKLLSETICTAERPHGEMLCCIDQCSCCSVGEAVCPNGDEGDYQCRQCFNQNSLGSTAKGSKDPFCLR